MNHHRMRILAAIAGIAAVGALVVGAVAVVAPARATPASGVTTVILAKSVFDEIHVKAHTRTPNHWRAQIKTHGQSDGYVVDNKFAPGGTSGWHSHRAPA